MEPQLRVEALFSSSIKRTSCMSSHGAAPHHQETQFQEEAL